MFTAFTKFLLTSEYLVLDNVPALATPLRYTQTLTATPLDDNIITLHAYDHQWQQRYDHTRDLDNISGDDLASQSLLFCHQQWLITWGYSLTTHIDFPRLRWLGTSSTLLSLIAQRSGCDIRELYDHVSNGSWYDIACAQASSPLIYTRHTRSITPVSLQPSITDHLFFVYSNHKQTSHREVTSYRQRHPHGIDNHNKKLFTDITHALLDRQDIASRQELLTTHDTQLAHILWRPRLSQQLPRTQQLGVVKPLWARWGDFFMIISDHDPSDIAHHCQQAWYQTCLSRDDIQQSTKHQR